MKKIILLISITIFSSIIYGQDYNIVVSRDGTGNYRNLQDAVNSIRAYMANRTTIYIKNGVYKEKVVIPSWITNLTLIGESVDKTIITWDDHANIDKMGTFKTYTIWVQGNSFRAENITFENNAAQLGQAVAVHVDGDKAVFINCKLLGNQDTLLTANQESRQYFECCYIEGTTDFIFGPATVWFENCQIHSKKDSYITAASTVQEKKFGYVFNNCRLTAAEGITKVYLGRPWRSYAATLFMNCELGNHIIPQGWDNWKNPENEKTTRYSEYKNFGPGSLTGERVGWSRQLSDKEAMEYTLDNVFARDDKWIPTNK